MKKESGITLIELMTVIAIIAIISAIAIPNMIGWVPKYRLQNAASDLRGELQATRMRAIRENREIAAYFDLAANRYQILDSGGDRIYGSADDLLIKTIDLNKYYSNVRYGHGNAGANDAPDDPGPVAGNVSFNGNAAVFQPTGLIRNDASFGGGYAYLTNSRGDAFAVGVPTIAGVVSSRIWNGGWTQ